MEEELNENELEERLYAMLHYVDETQANVDLNKQNESLRTIENAPRSTLRRYWRTSGDQNTPHQKINTPKENPSTLTNKNTPPPINSKPKEERPPTPSADLSIFQSPIPQNIKKTIQILDNDLNNQVILESSDEDEVIEVALPPKPTITIESSDEDEISVVTKNIQVTEKPNAANKPNKSGERAVSASPVPSVVSSVSDEFIRGDCIALNISSRVPDNHSFDFSLHGSDILDQSTPAKKKKKKKTKDASTSTPIASDTPDVSVINADECFATPKSKAKNKKQKNKSYAVSQKSLPSADVYDSDSNQSIIDANKSKNAYAVTNKSIPSADVYESDSNQSEVITNVPQSTPNDLDTSDSSVSVSPQKPQETPKSSKKSDAHQNETVTIDLTENESYVTLDDTGIDENIVIGNVTGFSETDDYSSEGLPNHLGSTNLPAILNEDLDFDNFKGKDKVCKRRRYSLTTLRAEMEKFYNESWGGENFNHKEIQKNMSRDKSLWVIDPKDRMPALAKRKVTCNYCNRPGHRDDMCRAKPAVCYMCGNSGHYEPRCPSKICVNCGSPNHMYSTMCHNCASWNRITCAECGQNGHPSSHCPDLWRRYHNTIDTNTPLEENRQVLKNQNMFCSGCTRRGHLVHSCRTTLPFSGFPINSPYVSMYRPIYFPTKNNQKNKQATRNFAQDSTISSATASQKNDRNKRQSKSPTCHESHVNKKRNTSTSTPTIDASEMRRNAKSPVNTEMQRKTSFNAENELNKEKEVPKELNKSTTLESSKTTVEAAPDFIPITSSNHDKKGHVIQDNEVSDTSDIVTSARIYVTSDIINKLKTEEGEKWLKETTAKHDVTVQCTETNSFLSIKGKVGDQEQFQTELRDYTRTTPGNAKSNNETDNSQDHVQYYLTHNLPKNKNSLLRELNKSFELLKNDLGDPKHLHKELTFLQNRQQQLLKQKVVSPQKLFNNRTHIHEMMRKLNIILLGQAGLADGSKHLSELYALQEKVTSCRQKIVSVELRREIGKHYHSIFTSLPRDDYVELVKKYYKSKPIHTTPKKSKKEKALPITPKRSRQKKSFNGIPKPHNSLNAENEVMEEDNAQQYRVKPTWDHSQKKMLSDVIFYHKKLSNATPKDSVLKKTRVELVRRLHSFITVMFNKDKLSSKTVKKLIKVRGQAQQFLSNMGV